MANPWIYLVAGLAMLLIYASPENPIVSKWGSRRKMQGIFEEAVELFIHAAILLILYLFVLEVGMPRQETKEFLPLVFMATAYLLAQIREKEDPFFLVVFAVAFFVLEQESVYSFQGRAFGLIKLVLGVALFRIMMEGLRLRLLLSQVPKPIKGLPLVFLAASLVAFALAGFQGVLS